MSNKSKIIDIETKCRLCLGDEGFMSYLFNEILLQKVENITKCTSIVITEDKDLPNKICHVCMYKLDTWNEFKEQFIKSNQILLAQLEPAESNDLTSETYNPKRKHDDFQASGTKNVSESVTPKRSKQDKTSVEQPLESTNADCVIEESTLNDTNLPVDTVKVTVPKENPDEQRETPASHSAAAEIEEGKDKSNEIESESKVAQVQKKPTLIPLRYKHLVTRRGKTTARRKASTKRWVARKKALLAATGGYGSDTDSIISENESKLSPVQKARAKTNADKEVEKQKKLARALKNLETDMKGEYGFKYDSDTIIIPHSDSEANKHQTRSQKKMIIEKVSTNETKSLASSMEKGNSRLNMIVNEEIMDQKENNSVSKVSKQIESGVNSLSLKDVRTVTQDHNSQSLMSLESRFNTQPIRSEIKVGDATFIVTSSLVLSESHYLNKTDVQNSSIKDVNGVLNTVDENSQERNTDIIDAVQLRRINPKSQDDAEEKRNVERCLNIEVEGTEFEALQKLQADLATFVEKDMKNKLSKKDSPPDVEMQENKLKDSFQTLDQQLKSIVETTIRKNIGTSSQPRKIPDAKVRTYKNQKVSTFSPAFVKAAMKSKTFQPKVLLMRLDLGKVRKRYRINNISLMDSQKSNDEDIEDGNRMSNERQTESSIEHRTLNLVSDGTSNEEMVTSTPRVYKKSLELMSEASKTNKLLVQKLSGPKGRKKLSLSEKVLYAIRKGLTKDLDIRRVEKSVCETVECDTTTKTLPLRTVVEKQAAKKVQFSKNVGKQTIKLQETIPPKYSCDICDQTFLSVDKKDEHLKSHKLAPAVISDAVSKAKKPRMMRCKRCHEVVDARLVRVHTCRSIKFHKCYVCNAIFQSEKALVSHLETHEESEFNIDNIEREQSTEKVTNITSTQPVVAQRAADSNTATIKVDNEYCEKGNQIVHKEEYTCFVCDKKFTDEEILKDHLQQHCNDVSDDDASSGKEQYQCAICGDAFETEDTLESHLEKHLCDDQDDNPNLINISNDSEHETKDTETEENFKCSQCFKKFDSEITLALHMQAHEEELAIAEWQKESTVKMKVEEQFFCAICEESFNGEEELSQHLDVHNSNSHVCFLCEQPFLSLEELQIHVASH